ncbi:hypothetical protein OROGR_006149 [Orobanche gracilis]
MGLQFTSTTNLSALGLLNNEITGPFSSSRGLQYSFMHVPVSADDPNNISVYTTCGGFPLIQDFKPPTRNFSLDGIYGSAYASVQETGSGSVLFSFEDLKQASSSTAAAMDQNHNHKEQQGDSAGYWSGMLGSGGSW